jgi:hypothetical protein
MKKILIFVILFVVGCQDVGDSTTVVRRQQEPRSLVLANERARKNKTDVYDELLVVLDVEYGAAYRSSAVQKFSELAAQGKVPKGNPVMATMIMERCYKETKDELSETQSGQYQSRINTDYIDFLLAGEWPKKVDWSGYQPVDKFRQTYPKGWWVRTGNTLMNMQTGDMMSISGNSMMDLQNGELYNISPNGNLMNLNSGDMWFNTGMGSYINAQTGELTLNLP